MRSRIIGGFGVAATFIAAGLTGAPAIGAATPQAVTVPEAAAQHRSDSFKDSKFDGQVELKQQAIAAVINGKTQASTRNGSSVVRVGNRWIELKRKADQVDPVFTVLAEFGDQVDPKFGGTAGPLHNLIEQPTPENNSTYWKSDFNQAHFKQMMFGSGESMADFYYKQSGGKYSVKGDVTDWVKLTYNEARYGANADENNPQWGDSDTYWPFINDTIDSWYAKEKAAGKSDATIEAYLAQYDVWDRFDADDDGNFNEPDGYLDHFQAVHAGEGEEAGGGAQGDDAIWSHRWSVFPNGESGEGAGPSLPGFENAGGARVGNTKFWVRDYVTMPENGGLGVFAHEYGHDLGLPDFYDTAGGDNGTAFWTLMSGGSWMSNAKANNIGTSPVYMGPEEKLYLGWLDYVIAKDGKVSNVVLGSAATPEGPLPQAVAVPLPDKSVTTDYNKPHSGTYEWWSGTASDLKVNLYRDLDLRGATHAKINAKTWMSTEKDYDYFRAQVSTDGLNWTDIVPPASGDNPQWSDTSIDLSAYAGQQIKFRFRYQSDGGVNGNGVFIDDISLVTDATAGGFTDNVEGGANGWNTNASGAKWQRITGSHTQIVSHFYLAELRTYTGYDKNFKSGPYNFVGPTTVEKFPYQDGLLVWYVNYGSPDNNTSGLDAAGKRRPGIGRALPVDARPAPVYLPGATCGAAPTAGNPDQLCKLGNRRQPFDATFGRQATDAVTFTIAGQPVTVPSRPGISVFDDSDPNRYWSAQNPWSSVKVAGNGVKIQVVFEMSGLLPMMILKVTN